MPHCGGIDHAISCEIHLKKACELGIPQTTMMDHMKLDLKVRPFHPSHVNELSNADMNAWKDACRALLAVFRSQRARAAVLFTGECFIYRNVLSRNTVFSAKENPHFYEELERNPPHVMMWAGLSATHVWPFHLSWFRYWTGLANVWYQNCNKRASKTLLSCNWMEHHHTLPCTWVIT
jgi:hypothetical protein